MKAPHAGAPGTQPESRRPVAGCDDSGLIGGFSRSFSSCAFFSIPVFLRLPCDFISAGAGVGFGTGLGFPLGIPMLTLLSLRCVLLAPCPFLSFRPVPDLRNAGHHSEEWFGEKDRSRLSAAELLAARRRLLKSPGVEPAFFTSSQSSFSNATSGPHATAGGRQRDISIHSSTSLFLGVGSWSKASRVVILVLLCGSGSCAARTAPSTLFQHTRVELYVTAILRSVSPAPSWFTLFRSMGVLTALGVFLIGSSTGGRVLWSGTFARPRTGHESPSQPHRGLHPPPLPGLWRPVSQLLVSPVSIRVASQFCRIPLGGPWPRSSMSIGFACSSLL